MLKDALNSSSLIPPMLPPSSSLESLHSGDPNASSWCLLPLTWIAATSSSGRALGSPVAAHARQSAPISSGKVSVALSCIESKFSEGVNLLSTAVQLSGKIPIVLKPLVMLWFDKTFFRPKDTHCASVSLEALWFMFRDVQ